MTVNVEAIAHNMFIRNATAYEPEPALLELAWVDPAIRNFWIGEAQAVLDDIAAQEGHVR